MNDWVRLGARTIVSGTLASLASTLALAALARAEGKSALRPANATSHWLNGPAAGRVEAATARHTGVGLATHEAACLFWALPFALWTAGRGSGGAATVLRDALVLSAIAATVDYTITPKRFTPGWEDVLSKRSMAAAYGAMAVGLTAGALIDGHRR